jgi:hypothetical protein
MKNSKSVFALSVAGVTLASAIGIASPAGAFNFVYDKVTYDVTTHTGSFNDLKSTLTAPNNALWGNPSLAEGLAGVVKGDLGYQPSPYDGQSVIGPYFAYNNYDYAPTNYFVVDAYNVRFNYYFGNGYISVPEGLPPGDTLVGQTLPNITYATATAVPEPLTMLGAITAAGFGVAFKRKQNSKQEE